jgi:hypothetical protein
VSSGCQLTKATGSFVPEVDILDILFAWQDRQAIQGVACVCRGVLAMNDGWTEGGVSST